MVFLNKSRETQTSALVLEIDDSFPVGQFSIDGFSLPYSLDRSCHGGGLMLFVRKDISSKLFEMKEKTNRKFLYRIKLAQQQTNLGNL